MNVKFTNTTSAKLDSLTVQNGQIIALSDTQAFYYDLDGTRHSVSGVSEVTSLPAAGQTNMLYVLYVSGSAHLYTWNSSTSAFVEISGGSTRQELTWAEYQALSEEEKMNGTEYFITDRTSSSSGPTALADLDDVDIASKENQAVLQYNSTSQKWEASGSIDYVISTTWESNTDIGDYSTYPYKQTISSTVYSDNHDCLVLSATPASMPTADEMTAMKQICQFVDFSNGVTVLAKEATATALTLRVRGV